MHICAYFTHISCIFYAHFACWSRCNHCNGIFYVYYVHITAYLMHILSIVRQKKKFIFFAYFCIFWAYILYILHVEVYVMAYFVHIFCLAPGSPSAGLSIACLSICSDLRTSLDSTSTWRYNATPAAAAPTAAAAAGFRNQPHFPSYLQLLAVLLPPCAHL